MAPIRHVMFLILGLCTLALSDNELSIKNNMFSIKLFNEISTTNKNFVCSPLSVAVVLSMLLDGAKPDSDTFTELQSTLGYGDLPDLDASYKDLIPRLQSSKDYTLSLANSLWVIENFPILAAYKTKMADVFQASASSYANLTDGATKINDWVNTNTNGMIPKLYDPTLPDGSVLVLVNAIYFKGNWVTQFQETFTQIGDFNNGNSKIKVSFMNQQQEFFPYKDSTKLDSKILQLPYKGNSTMMVAVLANDPSTDLNTLIGNPDFISEAFGSFSVSKVYVKIPKFKIETSIPLVSPLKNLGTKTAFTDSADFSSITGSPNIKVTDVVQKAVIDVNERGSEAAAATGATGGATSVGPGENIKYFTADRPFIYVIYHITTESILFLGKYVGIDN